MTWIVIKYKIYGFSGMSNKNYNVFQTCMFFFAQCNSKELTQIHSSNLARMRELWAASKVQQM